MLRRKLLAGVAAAAVGMVGMGGTANADHAHFVVITDPNSGETVCQTWPPAGRSLRPAIHCTTGFTSAPPAATPTAPTSTSQRTSRVGVTRCGATSGPSAI